MDRCRGEKECSRPDTEPNTRSDCRTPTFLQTDIEISVEFVRMTRRLLARQKILRIESAKLEVLQGLRAQ